MQNEVTCTYVYGFSSLFYMDLPPPVTSTSPQSLPASPSLLLQSHPPSRPAHLQSQPLNLVSLTWKPLPLHRLSSGGLLQATGRTSFHFPQHFLVLRTRLPVAALSQAQFPQLAYRVSPQPSCKLQTLFDPGSILQLTFEAPDGLLSGPIQWQLFLFWKPGSHSPSS